MCSGGSDEILTLLLRAYAGPGDEVLYSQHGFLMYPIGAKGVGATPVTAPEKNLVTDVDAMLSKVTPRTKLVFVATPNSPTGTYLPAAELRRLHAGLPGNVVLVLDGRLCRICDGRRLRAGQRPGARRRQCRHDADLLQDVRHGRPASRLGAISRRPSPMS